MKKCLIILLNIILILTLVGCSGKPYINKISSEDIDVSNFSEYFVITKEYRNIEWLPKEEFKRTGNKELDFLNGMISLVTEGSADLCIDIINKEQISGLMVSLEIKVNNNKDGWCKNAGYDVIKKDVYITSEEITSVVIPRTAKSFNGKTEPDINCVEIKVTEINAV